MNFNLVGLLLNLLAGITAGVSVAWGAGVHSGSGLFAAGMAGAVPAVSGFLTNRTKEGGSALVGAVPTSLEETLLAVADEIKRGQIVRKQQEQAAIQAQAEQAKANAQRAAELRAELAKLTGSTLSGEDGAGTTGGNPLP